jgi:hypothetical protein
VAKWKWTNQVSNCRRGELKSAQTLRAGACAELEPVVIRQGEPELVGREGVSSQDSAPRGGNIPPFCKKVEYFIAIR